MRTNMELYRERFPESNISDTNLEDELAQLYEAFTEEQVFFSINFLSKYYKKEALEGLTTAMIYHKMEIQTYYNIAKVKQARSKLQRSASEYDPKNEYKGKNTPSWFGKSFDKHLFE